MFICKKEGIHFLGENQKQAFSFDLFLGTVN